MVLSLIPVMPAAAVPATPKTIYVDAANGDDVNGDGTAGNPYMSITAGLDDANYGDTVDIAPGTYSVSETGETFPLPISPSKITLQGSDPYECIIDAEWNDTIIWMMDGSEFDISGLTLTHGFAGAGGAVMANLSTLTMTDCILTQNFAETGGAIYAISSTVTLTDCELTENGESAFAMVPAGLTPQGMTGSYSCGAILAGNSTLQIDGCTFGDNSAGVLAGAIGAEASELDISDSSFYENALAGTMNPQSVFDFSGQGLVPTDVYLPFGGAVLAIASDVSVTDSAFWENSAFIGSSLMGLDASMTVEGSWFEGDTTMAGVVASIGDLSSSASTDALGELAPTVEMLATSLTVEGSMFDGNEGAPIAVQAVPARISNCLITNNQASGGEGPDQGVLLFFDSDADLINTTIADNSTSGYSIYSEAIGVGGASAGGVRVTNSIVWDEFAEMGSVYGADVSYSDLYSTDPIVPEAYGEDVISEDPMFRDPESGDYSLAAGSPCIDTGVDFELAPDADIDGTPRPFDGDASGTAEWDMGAYEFGGVTDGRLAGVNRYETSVAISQDHFASAKTAVLVTGRVFADGLSAAGLAGAYDAPILLTQPKVLPSAVAAELVRLGVSHVIICGDQRAISDSVAQAVAALGDIEVERIGGADRYETSAMLADEVVAVTGDDPGFVFIARGDTFPDALAVSPLAWAHRLPILLVRPQHLPRYTIDFLSGLADTTKTIIVGSEAAVSLSVQGELSVTKSVPDRIGGTDRYDTAAMVATWADDAGLAGFGVTGVATGERFADALCAGPGLGMSGGVLLLTPRLTAAAPTLEAIGDHRSAISALQVFGSGAAISDSVEAQLRAARLK